MSEIDDWLESAYEDRYYLDEEPGFDEEEFVIFDWQEDDDEVY